MIKALDSNVVILPEPIPEIELKKGIFITNPRPKTRKGLIVDIGKDVTDLIIGDIVEFIPINSPELEGHFIVDSSEKNGRILFKYN